MSSTRSNAGRRRRMVPIGGDGSAMGDVASTKPAVGVIKVGGYVERVSAPGGFNGISRDPVFSGKGKTLRFRTTADASAKAEESPPRDAAVTVQRGDGATRVLRGRWRCGP